MKRVKSKSVVYLHAVLGLFFTISGILTIGNKPYIFNIWIISLGLTFLIDPLKLVFLNRVNPKALKIFSYFVYAIVIISGVMVFSKEFNLV